MRCIESASRAGCSLTLCTILVATLALAPPVVASKRPRYGGTLRVELRASEVKLDPRLWKPGSFEAATSEKLAALLFDRLVTLDNYGRFQPQLAVEWTHDGPSRRWRFVLRVGVKFSDGSPLNSADVAESLQSLLPTGMTASAAGGAVNIQSERPAPDMLEILASGRTFVFRQALDGTLLGTGPFVVADSVPSKASPGTSLANHLRFRQNENHWAGRPFVDEVEATLGVLPLKALLDLQVGKADLIDLAPELVRRAAEANLRTWASWPVTMYAVRFEENAPPASDARVREALADSLDRRTIAGVLLQKQAEPTAALLPQWLSGYAFLFTMETNLSHAKEIRAALPASEASQAEPLRLHVDAAGDTAKLLGERVAVSSRQAGIAVQVINRAAQREQISTAGMEGRPGARLIAWRYLSLAPRLEFDVMAESLHLGAAAEENNGATAPEKLYARERLVIDGHRVVPLVAVPDYAGFSVAVRDWMPSRWGAWNLADVWLERDAMPSPSGDAPIAPNAATGGRQ